MAQESAGVLELSKVTHHWRSSLVRCRRMRRDYTTMRLMYTIQSYDQCRQRKLPSMPSHERKLYYFDDPDNDLCRDTSYGNDGRWSMGLAVEIGRQDHFWMFSWFCLLFCSSRISAQYEWRRHRLYHLRISIDVRWSFPVARIHRKVTLSGTDRLWDMWVRMIAYEEWLVDCVLSIFLSYYCTGLCSPGGLHLKRGMM